MYIGMRCGRRVAPQGWQGTLTLCGAWGVLQSGRAARLPNGLQCSLTGPSRLRWGKDGTAGPFAELLVGVDLVSWCGGGRHWRWVICIFPSFRGGGG